ncbi:hypothetical protein B0G76_8431 [Paraburkholderia sp. BL23I1N1]|nr:hypothetical protein B0G76_8431 [Paraburkholderia sp. BL23I1N1]
MVVNIVAGRETFTDGSRTLMPMYTRKSPRLQRADQFVSRNGMASDERVAVISEDAGEFEQAIQGSKLARGRILD